MRYALVALCFFCSIAITCAQTGKYPQPHVIVYKTRGNYRKLVPVGLSGDKKKIAYYPAPADIKSMMPPEKLSKGYLLDHSGVISPATTFLRITYAHYARLHNTWPREKMMRMIVSPNPVTELYDCGTIASFTNIRQKVNRLIDSNQLQQKCKRIK